MFLSIVRSSKKLSAVLNSHKVFKIEGRSIYSIVLKSRLTKFHRLSFHKAAESIGTMEEGTFKGIEDRFNGITVDSTSEPANENLVQKIEDSLKKWEEENRRCIWFKVNIKDASWVPVLAKNGFNFHHSRDGYVMMYRWLPKNQANLPPACHTNLGVGGLVINDKNQVLVVSEKHYQYPHWKLPGGYVERGEDIISAAVREVKEETGIDGEFESLISIRHTHNMTFENSDVYVIARLKPLHENIEISEREINKCQWMDIAEYLEHPNVHDFNRKIVTTALEYQQKGIKISGEKKTLKFGNFVRDITYFDVKDS